MVVQAEKNVDENPWNMLEVINWNTYSTCKQLLLVWRMLMDVKKKNKKFNQWMEHCGNLYFHIIYIS